MPTPGARAKQWLRAHGVLLLVLSLAALAWHHTVTWASPTYDEPSHLVRGLSWWWQGDPRLSVAHPPLGNAFTGAPAAWGAERVDLGALEGWSRANVGQVARAYLEIDYEAGRAALVRARGGTVILGLTLLALVYVFTRRWFSPRAAAVAVVLLASQPILLAHGALVTTDLPVTLAMFVVVMALVGYLARPQLLRAIGLGFAVGACAATKYSGALAGPLVVLVTAVGTARGWGRTDISRARRWQQWLVHTLVLGAVVLAVIAATYRGRDFGPKPADLHAEAEPEGRAGAWERWPAALPIPLPEAYARGLASVGAQVEGGRRTWLLGRWYPDGVVGYFPLLILVQSTEALVLLLGLALAMALMRRRPGTSGASGARVPPLALAVVITFAAAILAAAMASNMNIGVRHVLPVLPLLTVLAAAGADAAWTRARWLPIAIVTLLATSIGAAALSQPRHLGYFNLFAGGRAAGHRISIIGEDWGQDVGDLAAWAQREGADPLWYFPYLPSVGMHELEHHGARAHALRCKSALPARGFLAVHANAIVRNACFPALADRTPVIRINEHIWVYAAP